MISRTIWIVASVGGFFSANHRSTSGLLFILPTLLVDREAQPPGIVGTRMEQQRWRAVDILRLGIGDGQQLVYTRPTRTAQVLPRAQAALLASCQTFRTIDEHARAAASQPSDVAAIRAQLETFGRDGFLVEEASL